MKREDRDPWGLPIDFDLAAEKLAAQIRSMVPDGHRGALLCRRVCVILESGWIPRRRRIVYHDRHGEAEEALRTRMRGPEGCGPKIEAPGSPS